MMGKTTMINESIDIVAIAIMMMTTTTRRRSEIETVIGKGIGIETAHDVDATEMRMSMKADPPKIRTIITITITAIDPLKNTSDSLTTDSVTTCLDSSLFGI